tara:strand:+ start:1025 stop:1333 length:309 start_codon:yes stop_codon:yes gene_type:complete
MTKMNNRISDKTSLNISLPMIIQVVGFISAMVWGYSQLTTRMSFVENEATRNTQAIKEIKELQDAPIPSDIKQDTRLDYLEAQINNNNDDLEYIKRRMFLND